MVLHLVGARVACVWATWVEAASCRRISEQSILDDQLRRLRLGWSILVSSMFTIFRSQHSGCIASLHAAEAQVKYGFRRWRATTSDTLTRLSIQACVRQQAVMIRMSYAWGSWRRGASQAREGSRGMFLLLGQLWTRCVHEAWLTWRIGAAKHYWHEATNRERWRSRCVCSLQTACAIWRLDTMRQLRRCRTEQRVEMHMKEAAISWWSFNARNACDLMVLSTYARRLASRFMQRAVRVAWYDWQLKAATAEQRLVMVNRVAVRLLGTRVVQAWKKWAAVAGGLKVGLYWAGRAAAHLSLRIMGQAWTRLVASTRTSLSLALRMLSACRLRTLLRWRMWAKQRWHDMGIIGRALQRMCKVEVWHRWCRWRGRAADGRSKRRQMEAAASRLAHLESSMAWNTWRTMALVRGHERSVAGRAVMHLVHGTLASAFTAWVCLVEKVRKMRWVAVRVASVSLSWALVRWASVAGQAKAMRALGRRVVERLRQGALWRCWAMWQAQLMERGRVKEMARKAGARLAKGIMGRGWLGWREAAAARAQQVATRRRVVLHLVGARVACAWATWVEEARWLKAGLYWAGRAAAHLSLRIMGQAWTRFVAFTRTQLLREHSHLSLLVSRLESSRSQSMVKWQSFAVQSCYERARIRCGVQHMKTSHLSKTWRSWRAHAVDLVGMAVGQLKTRTGIAALHKWRASARSRKMSQWKLCYIEKVLRHAAGQAARSMLHTAWLQCKFATDEAMQKKEKQYQFFARAARCAQSRLLSAWRVAANNMVCATAGLIEVCAA